MKTQMPSCWLSLTAAVTCFAVACWIDWTYTNDYFRVGDVHGESHDPLDYKRNQRLNTQQIGDVPLDGKSFTAVYDELNQRLNTAHRMAGMKPLLLVLSGGFLAIAWFSWYSRCRKEPTSIPAVGAQDAQVHER